MQSFQSFVLQIELLMQFDEVAFDKESASDWYCGVTGQGKIDSIFQLQRILDHFNGAFPTLDVKSICKVKASSRDIAIGVEQLMKAYGFDIEGNLTLELNGNEIWVYAFRKERRTFYYG